MVPLLNATNPWVLSRALELVEAHAWQITRDRGTQVLVFAKDKNFLSCLRSVLSLTPLSVCSSRNTTAIKWLTFLVAFSNGDNTLRASCISSNWRGERGQAPPSLLSCHTYTGTC